MAVGLQRFGQEPGDRHIVLDDQDTLRDVHARTGRGKWTFSGTVERGVPMPSSMTKRRNYPVGEGRSQIRNILTRCATAAGSAM